jgi:hypothetical protein
VSKLYTADGKRRSSQTHARHTWKCECGRVLNGNGGISSHKRACRVWAEYWLPRLDELIASGMLPETQARLQHERDELRARHGIGAATERGQP